MNKVSKYSLAIVEPTDIISEGLANMLRCLHFKETIKCKNPQDFIPYSGTEDLIVLANPDLLRKDPRNELKLESNKILIAISYSAFDESLRGLYDNIIFLYDDIETIISKIKKEVDKNNSIDKSNQRYLSQREKEILTAVAYGKTNKEIADELCISINTVVTHRKNISTKLGINSIAGLTVYAVLHKLIDSDKIL